MSPVRVLAPRGLHRLDVRLAILLAVTVAALVASVALERSQAREAREDAVWAAAAGTSRTELVRLLYLTQRMVSADASLDRDALRDSVILATEELDDQVLVLRNGNESTGQPAPRDSAVLYGIRRLGVRWRNEVKPSLFGVVNATHLEDDAIRFNALDLVGWRFYAGLDSIVVSQEASVAARHEENQGVVLPLRLIAFSGLALALMVMGGGLLRVRRLATATQGLAVDLDRPVGVRGTDEIAYLGNALESLRLEVRGSIERESRFFQVSRTLLAVLDYHGVFRRVNPAWARLVDLSPAQMLGKAFIDLVHPDDRRRTAAVASAFRDGNHAPRELEIQMVDTQGEVVHIAWSVVPSPEERFIYCVGHDVTDRKQAEAGVRRADRTFETLVESAPDAILLFNHLRTIRFSNGRATEILHCDGSALIGADICDLVSPAERAALAHEVELVLGDRRKQPDTRRAFFRALRSDGSAFPIELALSSIRYEGEAGPGAGIAIIRDRSETESLEAQLRQSQKMEAIGRLAGGVAHDFNNLLTVILANSSGDVAPVGGQGSREGLEEIHAAAERAATLTRQLLSFSRKQVLHVAVVDVHDMLDDVTRLLARILGADIRVQVRRGTEQATVLADLAQLEQAVLNLAVNARDAMPAGGVLTFETALEDRETIPGGRGTRHVRLSVKDTGTGMDNATLQRVFEPFFTTKPVGKGTGLGLATVYGSLRQMGGTVEVESELGAGTTFHIWLPLARGARQVRVSEQGATQAAEQGTILVVDDDAAVLSVTRRTLEKIGYRVMGAGTPDEALRILSEVEQVDLAVLDVVLGECTGPEVAQRLRELSPGLRLLFVSGHADTALIQRGILDAGHAFLGKPFARGELAAKVRSVLSGSPVESPVPVTAH